MQKLRRCYTYTDNGECFKTVSFSFLIQARASTAKSHGKWKIFKWNCKWNPPTCTRYTKITRLWHFQFECEAIYFLRRMKYYVHIWILVNECRRSRRKIDAHSTTHEALTHTRTSTRSCIALILRIFMSDTLYPKNKHFLIHCFRKWHYTQTLIESTLRSPFFIWFIKLVCENFTVFVTDGLSSKWITKNRNHESSVCGRQWTSAAPRLMCANKNYYERCE